MISDWYVITNTTNNVFLGQDKNGGVKMTQLLNEALIAPYGLCELFIKTHVNEDAQKIFIIRKIKLA